MKSIPVPLAVIAVIAILLGLLDVAGGLCGLAATVSGVGQNQELPPGTTYELEQAYEHLMAASTQYQGIGLVLTLVNMVVGVLLLAGGSMTFARAPIARNLLMGGVALGLISQLLGLALQVLQLVEILPAMGELAEAADSMRGSGPQIGAIITASMWTGVVVGFAMVLAIGLYYVATLAYLAMSEAAAAFFEPVDIPLHDPLRSYVTEDPPRHEPMDDVTET